MNKQGVFIYSKKIGLQKLKQDFQELAENWTDFFFLCFTFCSTVKSSKELEERLAEESFPVLVSGTVFGTLVAAAASGTAFAAG